MLKAGALNLRLKVVEDLETPDGAGGLTRSERVVGWVWAAKSHRVGVEFRAEGRVVEQDLALFTVRHWARLKPGQRLVESDGRVWHITGISDPDGRRELFRIEAREGEQP